MGVALVGVAGIVAFIGGLALVALMPFAWSGVVSPRTIRVMLVAGAVVLLAAAVCYVWGAALLEAAGKPVPSVWGSEK